VLYIISMDPSALLTQIEAAIEALLTGGASSYSIGARTVTKLDLKTLFEERRLLQAEVQSFELVALFAWLESRGQADDKQATRYDH
jgi:hypothetical protein